MGDAIRNWQKCECVRELVETGSHEFINLCGDDREGQHNAAEHGHLHLRREEFLRCGIDQFRLGAVHAGPVDGH